MILMHTTAIALALAIGFSVFVNQCERMHRCRLAACAIRRRQNKDWICRTVASV